MPFKVLQEKVKQALHVGAGGYQEWRPTSNERNRAMLEEAKQFASHLKDLLKDLSNCEKSISGGLGTIKTVLTTTLPKIYDEPEPGLGAHPVDNRDYIVGTNVNMELLNSAGSSMRQRLEEEVLTPLGQWLEAYKSIKGKDKKCIALALDLDIKRRGLADAQAQLEKAFDRGGKRRRDMTAAEKTKEDKERDRLEKKLHAENDKATRASQRHAEAEEEIFAALCSLLGDTGVLREYTAAAVFIMLHCFESSYFAFDLEASLALPHMKYKVAPSAAELQCHGNASGRSVHGSVSSMPGGGGTLTRSASTSSGGGAVVHEGIRSMSLGRAAAAGGGGGGDASEIREDSGVGTGPGLGVSRSRSMSSAHSSGIQHMKQHGSTGRRGALSTQEADDQTMASDQSLGIRHGSAGRSGGMAAHQAEEHPRKLRSTSSQHQLQLVVEDEIQDGEISLGASPTSSISALPAKPTATASPTSVLPLPPMMDEDPMEPPDEPRDVTEERSELRRRRSSGMRKQNPQ